ncbi:shikimate dehydrogenase (NADP(+)) [Actinoplanes lobatus]|uniref:Shikimate dehydrogenase (NADP(+)) n=2 Tax=Actinoplanes lobatus TaxID=113568 RepID=A0A7W7H9I3_9ACTN|nr:shikimate dehydrogenase [Actinoplanes lobatus]MBB4746399.1 shikimate dehydrogenase [Actinoplanes lobatus]GGN60275.1 shikimate dehydrogenase (NADP(+)) [Actinoplanes lobatus]GIE41288.1 shikimate dehydrogenase (NADP(+)) [Actinoplanes lobatus]
MAAFRCGLIGAGIGTSLSPALHEAEGRHHHLGLTYTLFDTGKTADLERLLDEADRAGFAGLNITHPFKQQVIEHLDDLSPLARDINAVNTVVFRDGRRQGHNTDAYGFAESFRSQLPDVAVRHVVQLGAGGAGAACAHALRELGAERLTIVDPDRARGAELADRIGARHATTATPELLADADGLVNASPIGMHHHPGTPLPAESLHRGLWVADIVYMPLETELLRAARARGLRTIGGTAMCAYQAAAAFELFTGRTPDIARMLLHLSQILERQC